MERSSVTLYIGLFTHQNFCSQQCVTYLPHCHYYWRQQVVRVWAAAPQVSYLTQNTFVAQISISHISDQLAITVLYIHTLLKPQTLTLYLRMMRNLVKKRNVVLWLYFGCLTVSPGHSPGEKSSAESCVGMGVARGGGSDEPPPWLWPWIMYF